MYIKIDELVEQLVQVKITEQVKPVERKKWVFEVETAYVSI